MGLRYRQRYFESGDILEPRDWNYNWAELASEVNGNLDSHNLATGAITEAHYNSRAASNIRGDSATDSLTTQDNVVSWINDDGAASPVDVAEVSFTADVDCVVVCEFGCTIDWDAADYAGGGGASSLQFSEGACVRFRIVVDGVPIAESGFLEESIEENSVYLCGVGIMQAGSHVVRVEYQKLYIDDHINEGATDSGLVIQERELIVHERYR